MWKQSVLEWRRDNPYEQLTKENFAPILEKVVENIKETNIINGFRACGLYPFEFSAIDVSKCLGKSNKNLNMSDRVEYEKSQTDYYNNNGNQILTYTHFLRIVGGKKIQEFEDLSKQSGVNISHKEENFQIIYWLWKAFKNHPTDTDDNKDPAEENDVNYEVNVLPTSEPNMNSVNVASPAEDISQNEVTYEINDIPIVFDDTEDNICIVEQEEFDPSVFGTDNAESATNSGGGFSNDSIHREEEYDLQESREKPIEESTSTEGKKSIKILQNYLLWPVTPERKNKRNIDKVPYIITSSGCKSIYTEKNGKRRERKGLRKRKKKIYKL